MAKHFANKKNDDLEMLLSDSQMPWTRTEGGCHKSTLVKALFLTSILLVLVCVSWFLHYNVFLDTAPVHDVDEILPVNAEVPQAQAQVTGQPEMCPPGPNPISLLDLDKILELVQTVNLSTIVVPPELSAKMMTHIPDIMNHNFKKLLDDKVLVDLAKQFFKKVRKVLRAQVGPALSKIGEVTTSDSVDSTIPTNSAKEIVQSTEHDHDNSVKASSENHAAMDHDHNRQLERQHRVE